MTKSKDMGGPCNVGDLLPVISRQVTQDRVDLYAEAAKDFNPVHLDEEFARTTQFGRRIAHGMLTLAFVSEMLEMAFPGTYAAGGELDVRFKAPVYPGETVETWGEIISVTSDGGIILPVAGQVAGSRTEPRWRLVMRPFPCTDHLTKPLTDT